MKKKTTKKILLPLCLMVLCFVTTKTHEVPLNTSEKTPQIIPLSDRECEIDDTKDH